MKQIVDASLLIIQSHFWHVDKWTTIASVGIATLLTKTITCHQLRVMTETIAFNTVYTSNLI